LKYHLYRNYFPVYALARYRNMMQGASQFCGLRVNPQEFKAERFVQESE